MRVPFIPGRMVEVPEIPYRHEIVLEADKTALVIVDMQNDFVKPGGGLVVPAAEDTVPGIRKLLESARGAGVHVAFSQDTMFPDDPEFSIWPPHCVLHTPGWEIIDELTPRENELVCQKPRYDAYYGTMLDHFCTRVWNIRNLVIAGTVSNICVMHTAASAGQRWIHVVMPADGVSALTEFDQALTFRQVTSLYNGEVIRSTAGITFTDGA